MDVDDRVPLVGVHFVKHPVAQDPRIVDHRIDPAKRVQGGGHHMLRR